ncbi:MAG TPA: acyltransferase domain-containing protein, partial [Steroidobacteraceae bacterium]
ILSPDGHCRAFDRDARGTVLGNGVGIVVLKRLQDALEARDSIYAVIKAVAINNDGAQKPGFTAPSVIGQAKCITECHGLADVSPESISYVETHGTGTEVGDPIEIAGLQQAFGPPDPAASVCRIGSVKTNIGHLDAAAGVAGLIKVALMLHHGEQVPSLHFRQPNPQIDLSGRFRVSERRSAWPRGELPRRAGVSSFGLGGTNAHAILEEAPPITASTPSNEPRLLLLSAKSASALEAMSRRLADHLRRNPELNIGDVAYTLRVGRTPLAHRRFIVAADIPQAIFELERTDLGVQTGVAGANPARVAMLFPGQGSQSVGMASAVYRTNPVFARNLDRCLDLLHSRHGMDLREVLCSSDVETQQQRDLLKQTQQAQPALFAVCYAMAATWADWGIRPHSALGHSIGEWVAATVAGVFTLELALELVVARGRLVQQLPNGSMLAVRASSAEVSAQLPPHVDLAGVNADNSCVVSGEPVHIERFRKELDERGIPAQLLQTSHAFHSRMMEPVVERLSSRLASELLQAPSLPFISNVTGDWIEPREACNPAYWGRHLRETVQFDRGLATVLASGVDVLLECGPGHTLTQFAKRHPLRRTGQMCLTSVPEAADELLQHQLGRLWVAGAAVDWQAMHPSPGQRISLPAYPFEGQRFWIEPSSIVMNGGGHSVDLWQELQRELAAASDAILQGFDRDTHQRRKQALDELCVGYIHQALERLGLPGRGPVEASAAVASGVSDRYEQLLAHMLSTRNLRSTAPGTLQELRMLARRVWAGAENVVDLVDTCGEALSRVLRGEQAPLELFSSVLERGEAPAQSGDTLQASYNAILQKALTLALDRIPSSGTLRVLEIGGGTGIATSALLPMLPADRTHYTFTDIGSYFVTRAREKFQSYPFVEFATLDVDRAPQQQGLASNGYDVVIAVNMLHATRQLATSLRHVRSLLAPGGLLLIWEITRAAPDFAVTYGLLMNPVLDGERNQGNPFLNAARWHRVLRESGFEHSTHFPEDDFLEQQLFVAQVHSSEPASAPAPAPVMHKKADLGEWFHEISWKRQSGASASQERDPSGSRWLWLHSPQRPVSSWLQRLLNSGADVTTVVPGNQFELLADRGFSIRPQHQEDYLRLLQELRNQGRFPDRIVHTWGLLDDFLPEAQFAGLLPLVQALGAQPRPEPVSLEVITRDVHEVTGQESVLPHKALLLAMVRVAGLEYPHIHCRQIDITAGVDAYGEVIASACGEQVVALRGRHRWVQVIEPLVMGA